MKSAEWAQRNRRVIDSSPPLIKAKFSLSAHDFEKARRLLAEILKNEPNHPEALALMGMLYDVACLNKPAEAVKYYGRLADVKDNPTAVLTGLYLQCLCHWNAGDLAAALRASQKALEVRELFPPVRLTIDYYRRNLLRAIRERQHSRTGKGKES